MSYCSENQLPLSTPISRLFEVVELLGYQKVRNSFKIDNQIGSFVWFGNEDVISFVEIELNIYREKDYLSVQTRTRVGRSYWDLKWQNKTISLLKALFGGSFSTDAGNNRYITNSNPEPSKLASSLYVDRWVFKNAMIKPEIYLNSRELNADIAKNKPTGVPFLDELNPRILSDNLIIPYIVGCWESYFRNSYVSILKYSNQISDNALKNCKLSTRDYLSVVKDGVPLEILISESLSFQRPSIISENFKQLNRKINIEAWLKKPYHNRKTTLFDSITEVINTRNYIVHTGNMDLRIFDKQILKIMKDMTEAINRVYDGFGDIFDFEPSYLF